MTCVNKTDRAGIIRQAFDEAYDLCLGGNLDRAADILNRAFGNAAQAQADHVLQSIMAVTTPVRSAMWESAMAEDDMWTQKRLSALIGAAA